MVADRWKTDHVVRNVSVDDLELLDRLPQIYDEPFGVPHAIAFGAIWTALALYVTALVRDRKAEILSQIRAKIAELRARG